MADDTYSVVDLSKKVKNREREASEAEHTVPVYAAVDKSKKSRFIGAETTFSDTASPMYDSVGGTAAETVITTADAYNEGAESDYSMITVENLTNSDSCRVSREENPWRLGKRLQTARKMAL